MRITKQLLLFNILALLSLSCTSNKKEASPETTQTKQTHKPAFKTILDSAEVVGSILIYDLNENHFYSNDFNWANRGRLPASTFKIPNSIIALETGVITSDSTIFKWNGQKRDMAIWEQDLTLKQAFHYSCVPCYQEIARKVGVDRMNKFLDTLSYKNMVVTEDMLDVFWLEGDSKISQFQQIDFLKRFYESNLSISERTEDIMKKMIIIEETEEYILRGKTGWSLRKENNHGWFVGYIESKKSVNFFATNIEPIEPYDKTRFAQIRKEVTYSALKEMNLLLTNSN